MDLALRCVALILQKMFGIFPRNQAKAYGKKKSINFTPVATNYLVSSCGLVANCPLSPGCHLAYVLWLSVGEKSNVNQALLDQY